MKRLMYRRALLFIAILLSGCATSEVLVPHRVTLASATAVPEAELLDVGVVPFDPGVPNGEVDAATVEELAQRGVYVNVRRAESPSNARGRHVCASGWRFLPDQR